MDETTNQVYQKAYECFQRKEFDQSNSLFKEIKEKLTNNTNTSNNNKSNNTTTTTSTPSNLVEIQMNILISDFYSKNCLHHNKLIEDLNQLLKSLMTTKQQQQQANTDNNNNNNISPILSSTSTSTSSSSIVSPPITSLDQSHQQPIQHEIFDNEQAIILYNQSVIYFHIKQYGSGFKILDQLYGQVLSFDDYLAIRICLLFINVLIEVQLYDKANSVISFLEKSYDHFFYTTSGDDNNNNNYYQHTQMTPNEFKFLIHFNKSKIYLFSNSHYLESNQEIQKALEYSLKIDYSPLIGSCNLLKANYYSMKLDTGNTIKHLLSTFELNSNGNGNGGDKLISFGNDLIIEPITARMFYNNIGSLHFNIQDYTLANYYFSRALKEPTSTDKSGSTCVVEFNKNLDKRAEVFYNTGMVLMSSGKYELSFSCLQESCLLLKCNPLVWLRLAECCILAHQKKLKDKSLYKENENDENNDNETITNNDESSTTTNESDQKEKEKEVEKETEVNENIDKENSSSNNEEIEKDNEKKKEKEIKKEEKQVEVEEEEELIFGSIKILNNNNILLPIVSGIHQGLQIDDSDVLQSSLSNSDDPLDQESLNRLGTLSLDFASKCLRNAHFLEKKIMEKKKQRQLESERIKQLEKKGLSNSTNGINGNSTTNQHQHQHHCEETETDPFDKYHIELMLSILSSQAYVSLCTRNPIITLSASQQILNIYTENSKNGCSGKIIDIKYKYYAHLYSAEACLNLNLQNQAIKFLSLDFIQQQTTSPTTTTASASTQEFELSSTLYINLAIAYLINNDFENAEKSIHSVQNYLLSQHQQHHHQHQHQHLQQLNELSNKINLLKVYIELRKGNNEKALNLILNERPIPN